MAKDKMSAEEKEQEEIGLAGILPSILGGAAAIGGMIPSLLQGPQQRQLQAMQRGGGAGASLARQTASDAASRVVGATTTSGSRGRGGSLREGLRGAEQIVEQGGRQAATVGAAEAARATEMLRQNDILRRLAFRTLGAGGGKMLAGIGGMLAAARDQGETEAGQESDVLPGQFNMVGYGQPTGSTGDTTGMVTQTPGDAFVDRMQAERDSLSATSQPSAEPSAAQAAPQAQQRRPASSLTMSAFGNQPTPRADAMQQAVAQRVQTLSRTTADKQDAARLAASTTETGNALASSKPSTPPPMTDPAQVEEFLYNEAMNYNPALGDGMKPDEAARLLELYGFPVDWARLGIVDIGAAFEPAKE